MTLLTRPLHAIRTGAVPAGLVDSALSSLGSFVVGLAAVRYLGLVDLGVYALAYTAFLLGASVPTMLVLTPREVHAIAVPDRERRLGIVRGSLLHSLPVSVVAGAVVGLGPLIVPSGAPLSTRLAFTGSLLAVCALSPLQDHLRRVLHMADRSWQAAATAGIQVATILGSFAVLVPLDLARHPVVPFSVLALANAVSGTYALTRCWQAPGTALHLSLRGALHQGRPLLLGTVASFSGGFVIVAAMTAATGPAEAARYEAARLLAQPVSVVIVGLLAALGPRIMSSVAAGDAPAARSWIRRCVLVAGALVVPYVALTGLWQDGNPLRLLVPRAFDTEHLLPAMVVAQAVGYLVAAYRYVPLALRKVRHVLVIELVAAGTSMGLAVVLAGRGAWGGLIAAGIGAAVALAAFALDARRLLRRLRPTSAAVTFSS